MDTFEQKLNDLLVDTFRNITKVEEMIIQNGNTSLTLSETHLLAAVGDAPGGSLTIGELAAALGITPASVTVAVGKLMRKEYLIKNKSPTDGRSVVISLTRSGAKICRLHRYFHRKMVRSVTCGVSEAEKTALLSGVEKLDAFFSQKASELMLEE